MIIYTWIGCAYTCFLRPSPMGFLLPANSIFILHQMCIATSVKQLVLSHLAYLRPLIDRQDANICNIKQVSRQYYVSKLYIYYSSLIVTCHCIQQPAFKTQSYGLTSISVQNAVMSDIHTLLYPIIYTTIPIQLVVLGCLHKPIKGINLRGNI